MGNGDGYAMPFWWQKFRLDPYFNSALKLRWNELKANFINTTHINGVIDSLANHLAAPQVRNFTKWNILSTYIWPNNYVGGSYANEITYLKNWMRDRITWMDTQIQALQLTGIDTQKDYVMDLVTYPNPFTNQVKFKYYLAQGGDFELNITNSIGQKVFYISERVGAGINETSVNFNTSNAPGVYLYQILVDGKLRTSGKLIKQ